ncbi:cysteine peptidase family C39 domain-containing protein [Haliea sp. E1-2-M8]|uniref:C39 family peptidase n=1 Tax=Haliea sp. E1-2-M8 TaxID=3064706 RepID=UPI0027185939|nr:cysteine peptidase family C39 domain-containing protein [Haliea sp. E1-2-M8]MDO8860505.1 cysteine peptidase family C39 domain-containing protein [Haliea sp. E1-2-M8]
MPVSTVRADDSGFRNWVTLRDAGVVRQARDFSCGIAALATYLTYYLRHPVTEQDLLDLLDQRGDDWDLPADWREQGVSYAVLLQLAQHYGLQGAGMAVTPELLASLTVPAIVRLEVHGVAHFSVLRGIGDKGQVQLADPSWGNHRLNREAFLPLWLDSELGGESGTLMLFQPLAGSSLQPDAGYFGVDARQPLVRPPA